MKSTTSLFFILAATGVCHSALAIDEPAAAVTTNPALAGDGVQIGVAKRDGVTISGGEASVTRNGATEKLTKELRLPSGVIARPDGTVIMPDKTEATLRATQLLTFDGKIVPLSLDSNTNPGDPRGNGNAPVNTNGAGPSGTAAGTKMGNAGGTSRHTLRDQPAVNGSVFLGSDGVPFMGTLNADGTLLRADGTLLRADGSYRAVSFGPDGTPALGTVNNNGTITRADGSVVSPDGSVRSANGALISPAAQQNNLGTANNGNSNPGVPQQNNSGTTQTNNGVAAGTNTNSPDNTGTVNNGNTNAGATGGTQQGTNQQGTNQQGTNSNNASSGSTNGGTRGSNGAGGGAVSGGGASGAGGASGGAAGGASR